MAGAGILEYFNRRHPAVNDTCSRMKEEMTKARALPLQEVGAAFVVIAAGLPTAFTFLFMEVFVKNMKQTKV